MAIALLESPPVLPVVDPGMATLVTLASQCLDRATGLPMSSMDDEMLGEAIAGLAVVESRVTAVRMSLSAEADRRRVAEQTAETGTDAWLARLTGSTREQAAGGLRIARLLAEKYAATREAFAAGRLRVEQVRVIVGAAEQAPAEATRDQVQMAEEWLVAKATGDGSRTGRGRDAKRLRQTARRMFTCVDHDLAVRHEAILLSRETRTAEAETYLALHDNGDGSYTGRFQIPELHGHLLSQALGDACGAGVGARSCGGRGRTAPPGGGYVAGGGASAARQGAGRDRRRPPRLRTLPRAHLPSPPRGQHDSQSPGTKVDQGTVSGALTDQRSQPRQRPVPSHAACTPTRDAVGTGGVTSRGASKLGVAPDNPATEHSRSRRHGEPSPREVSPNRARGPTRTPDPSAHSPPTTAAPTTPASTSAEDLTATGPTTVGREPRRTDVPHPHPHRRIATPDRHFSAPFPVRRAVGTGG